MFERLTTKRTLLAVAGTSGALALAGCGNTVEGIGNVPMVHCGKGEQPSANSVGINSVREGDEIQLGHAVVTDQNGNKATGDFAIKSLGDGKFSVSINHGNSDNDATIIPNYNGTPNEVTVVDNGELYTVAGHGGPHGSTALDISASCQPNK